MQLNHIGTNSIETVRLLLRRFKVEDAEDMYTNWAGDAEVCKFLSWGPHANVDISRRRILNWSSNYDHNNFYVWAIELKSMRMVIGSISVEFSSDSSRTCEVGYCIGKQYWNRGIMTEALQTVLHYLCYEIGYQKVKAKHDVLNPASGRVMKKAGMKFEKMERQLGLRRDGSVYDCLVYSKLISDD